MDGQRPKFDGSDDRQSQPGEPQARPDIPQSQPGVPQARPADQQPQSQDMQSRFGDLQARTGMQFTRHSGQTTDFDGQTTLLSGITGTKLSYLPGDIVDNAYQLLKLLGRGGMGAVFSCRHLTLHNDYALKLLSADTLSSETWTRFQAEAKSLARLNHPGIVGVYNMGIDKNQCPYYVMDLLNGETLDARLKNAGQLPVDQALDVFIQVSDALSSAHQQGIIHRDVKPSNLMLIDDTRARKLVVKIVDFGIARVSNSSADAQSQTATGLIFGTPFYMSPEQCQGTKVDHRSDIYSFGCALFETLTGTPPFVGQSAFQTFMMHQNEAPPPLSNARTSQFPESLEVALQKMLAKRPAERYQSMGQVKHDLERIRAGKMIMAQGSIETIAPPSDGAQKALASLDNKNPAERARARKRAVSDGGSDAQSEEQKRANRLILNRVMPIVAALLILIPTIVFFVVRGQKDPNFNYDRNDVASNPWANFAGMGRRSQESAAGNGAADKSAVDGGKTDSKTSGDNRAGNNATGNIAAGNNATGNNATGNNATGNNATGNNATGNNTTGNTDAGKNDAGKNDTSKGDGNGHGAKSYIGDENKGTATTSDKKLQTGKGKEDDDADENLGLLNGLGGAEHPGVKVKLDPVLKAKLPASSFLYPWPLLADMGASKEELLSISIEDLGQLDGLRKDAENRIYAMLKDARFRYLYRDGAFHFPTDVIIGSISINRAKPVLATGTIAAPPGSEAFLYLLSSTWVNGGFVLDHFGPNDLTGVAMVLHNGQNIQSAIRTMLHWQRLKDLWFFNPLLKTVAADSDHWAESEMNDDVLPMVDRFPNLRSVGLSNPISGPAILKTRFVHTVEGLALRRVAHFEPLFKELPNLTNVKELFLMTLEVKDNDLKTIKEMKNLRKLTILRGFLTYDSVRYFKQMQNLNELRLDRNDWTPKQKADFQKQMPHCKITYEKVIDLEPWPMTSEMLKRFNQSSRI